MNSLLSNDTQFGNETGSLPNGIFSPEEAKEELQNSRILVLGAGGLGCELLKDLALSGFRDIHVIDMDNIDLTNLNRQFLFRMKDIGRPKAEVAAEFVMKRVEGVKIVPHVCYLQDKEEDFYKQFRVVIGGLDNLEARRWINALLVSFVEYDEDGNVEGGIIPFIDGGTQAFQGQTRVILPGITSCFDCFLGMFPPETQFAMCTIAETPRKPEHCVAYAMLKMWPDAFPDRKLDKDSAEDMQWIHKHALERAAAYGIEGLTYMRTMGVVKNIIPAIASTNAVIAAACANEAVKLVTFAAQSLNNYMFFNGGEGCYVHSYDHQPSEDCLVCQGNYRLTVDRNQLLKDFISKALVEKHSLKKPSITASASGILYIPVFAHTHDNMELPLGELIENGEVLSVTDKVLGKSALTITVWFEGESENMEIEEQKEDN